MSDSDKRKVTKRKDHTEMQDRLHDLNLNDPVDTESSEVDQDRATLWTNRKVPELPPTFSDKPHNTVKLDSAQPVPSFWQGQAEQHRDALPSLVGEEFPTTDGADGEEPTHHAVMVQTDYRESEVQTDPYSPEYVLKPGTYPTELLQLRPLTWGCGLPAGPAEVEMIKQARAKRAEEARLPPLSDLSQIYKRRRMMEEMEAKKWVAREQEIKKSQDSRLAAFKDQLRQRDDAQKAIANERLNRLFRKCQKEREAECKKINTDHIRALRELEVRRANVEGKPKRRDIVTDFCSLQTHKKVFPSIIEKKYTYEELERMETSLKPLWTSLMSDDIKARCKPRVNKAVELLNNYKALLEEEKQVKVEKPLRFLVKKEKPPPRLVTPRVEAPPEGEEEKELAIIAIQSMLRHIRVRSEVTEGVKNNQMLIEELLMANPLTPEDEEIQRADKEFVMALQKERYEQREKIAQEEEAHNKLVGAELALLFDTLAKERIRQQEEYKIHTFTALAEGERRRREAEEGGRRQTDEQRCKENDEILQHVAQVRQESVDMFLDDIISENVERFAEEKAREEILTRAKELNDVAYALEESRDSVQSEEIVSELVYSFLIPNVEKKFVRVHLKEQACLQAAQSIVQEIIAAAGNHPEQTSEITCSAQKSSDQDMKEIQR
ncbi:cilia- and flagella-associated protein 91 [Nematolebias whitei]|uniref:cilia- and flagella-associated protein 91 n=1 Tax=Nematolebias whitei TaxID=451745 RepID=UPI0018981E52|nr:cilia- and flagella-associated protein 91 [Nematolebias whitei]